MCRQAFIKPQVDSEDEVVSAKAFVAIDVSDFHLLCDS